MKNFKKVVFGLLAMLVMVTGVSAVESEALKPAIKNETDLVACMTATVSGDCTLASDVTVNSAIAVTSNVTLNLGNHKLVLNGNAINAAANSKLTLIGGTIEVTTGTINADGDLKIDGTVINAVGANGAVVTVTGSATSKATTVNLTNVTLDSDNAGIKFDGGKVDATLTGVKVESEEVALEVATPSKATIEVKSGDITSTTERAVILGSTDSKLIVNDGTITGELNGIVVSYGTAEIKGGNVVSNTGNAVSTDNSGVLNITGGKLTAKESNQAALHAAGTGAVTISGGEIVSEKYFAVHIDSAANNTNNKIEGGKFISPLTTSAIAVANSGKVVISGGEYTGAANTLTIVTGKLDTGLTAVRYGDTVYVGKAHTLKLEINKENAKEYFIDSPQTLLAGHEYKFADKDVKAFVRAVANEGYAVKYVLVTLDDDDNEVETVVTGDGFVMPDKDATLKISFVKAEEQKPAEEQQPSDTPSSGANDGEDVKPNENTNTNPSTFDGIASIVTMAVSSLGAAGYSIKKIIRK